MWLGGSIWIFHLQQKFLFSQCKSTGCCWHRRQYVSRNLGLHYAQGFQVFCPSFLLLQENVELPDHCGNIGEWGIAPKPVSCGFTLPMEQLRYWREPLPNFTATVTLLLCYSCLWQWDMSTWWFGVRVSIFNTICFKGNINFGPGSIYHCNLMCGFD